MLPMKDTTTRYYPQLGLGWALSIVLVFCRSGADGFTAQGRQADVPGVIMNRRQVDIRLNDAIKQYEDAEAPDNYCRRKFLTKASSLVSLPILVTGAAAANSAPDVASATSATTPSIAEGELAISGPPPNRATIVVGEVDKKEVVHMSETPVKSERSSKNKASDPRFFIAGGASAAISHGYTVPIDVVKTKIQIEPALEGLSLRDATKKIVDEEGPGELLVGVGPTVVGYGIEGALKFGLYESLKPFFLGLFPTSVDPSEPYLAAAVCAGAVASLILCPMEETRIRLVSDPNFASGLFDGLPRLLREDGALSPFKGLPSMLSKQIPYTAAKQVSFDIAAGAIYAALGVYAADLALGVEVAAAFTASIIACIASHPGDVLLTASYQSKEQGSGGFLTMISNIYDNGGFLAFFRGINARFVHVGFIITTQLVIYDQIKQALGLAASGAIS